MKERLVDALRPKSLDEVIGQDHIKSAVKKYVEQGCQRWLFHGPTGTGKTSLARIVAHELGAEEVYEFNGAEFGIDDIVELVNAIRCYPMRGKYRVIILDEAQAVTEAAKTALLKPLEDIDEANVWILCSMDVTKLHRALRDRCTASFKLNEMGPQERKELVSRAAKYLEYTGDTTRFLRELDARGLYSARDILVSFEKHANGMRAEDAVVA